MKDFTFTNTGEAIKVAYRTDKIGNYDSFTILDIIGLSEAESWAGMTLKKGQMVTTQELITIATNNNLKLVESEPDGGTADVVHKTVATAFNITTTSLPSVPEDVYYEKKLTVTGGQGRPEAHYVWSVDSGTLPVGVTLNASTGVLSGTPTTVGTSNFDIKVVNFGQQDIQSLSLEITV